MYRDIKILVLTFAISFLTACSSNSVASQPIVNIEESYIKQVVHKLSVEIGPRNIDHMDGLMFASRYIHDEFESMGYEVELQRYEVSGKMVENIIASIGPGEGERLVIGAHYDSCGNQPGADDNASGVAGLLALAKLFRESNIDLKRRIDFVAYTLEEPPFFRTDFMGSHVHAKSLHDHKVAVKGMIALEMIGYYSDEEDSQEYPLGILKLFYPEKGNFIGVVSDIGSSGLKSDLRDYMRTDKVSVRSLAAPASLVGVDFSDHMNYWKYGFDAVMVTDTAFYRNPNYHEVTDTIETLDFQSMKDVVKGLFYGISSLVQE